LFGFLSRFFLIFNMSGVKDLPKIEATLKDQIESPHRLKETTVSEKVGED
jgi:hypothetical protein